MSEQQQEVFRENLLIQLTHHPHLDKTEVAFSGEGIDAENDAILVDFLSTVAASLGYVLIDEDSIIFEER